MKGLTIVIVAALALSGPAGASELGQAVKDSRAAETALTAEAASQRAGAAFGGLVAAAPVDAGEAQGLGAAPPTPPSPAPKLQPRKLDIGMPEPEPGQGQEPGQPGSPKRGGSLFAALGDALLGLVTGPCTYGAAGVLYVKSKADENNSTLWLLAMPFALVGGFLLGIFMGPIQGFQDGWKGR